MTARRWTILALLAACGGSPQPPVLQNVAASDAPAAAVRSRCPKRTQPKLAPPSPDMGALAGWVLDNACEPIAGASLIVQKKVHSARAHFEMTDHAGQFTFRDLTPGTHAVTVYWLDSKQERDVKIRPGIVEQIEIVVSETGKAEPLFSVQPP